MANWKVLTLISIVIGLSGLIGVIVLYTSTGGHIPFDVRHIQSIQSFTSNT